MTQAGACWHFEAPHLDCAGLHDFGYVWLARSLIGDSDRRSHPAKVSDERGGLEYVPARVSCLERPLAALLVRFIELCCETQHDRTVKPFRASRNIVAVVHAVQRLDATAIRF
jgi:hypothetical protein